MKIYSEIKLLSLMQTNRSNLIIIRKQIFLQNKKLTKNTRQKDADILTPIKLVSLD
jgi:hypothetical protein